MNGDAETDEGNGKLGGFYAYKNTFNEKNVWVEVPKNGTQVAGLQKHSMQADSMLQ